MRLCPRATEFYVMKLKCIYIYVSLLGARTLLVAPGLTTSNKKLLVTKGIATSSKNATRGAPGIATSTTQV